MRAQFIARERLVRRLILDLGIEYPMERFTLRGVRLIPRYDHEAHPGPVDVEIGGGSIKAITPSLTADSDTWLVGGLVDAHVHTHLSERQTILHLTYGVTGVREMCGFPWLPERRERIASGLELGPRMFVAGHILASQPMEDFATVVDTPEQVFRAVEAQAALGFQAVKVHNLLDLERYDAARQAAEEHGLPLIGHVPHGVPVVHALHSGQLTLEHLKGYYQDWDLEISSEPWLEATATSKAWNCPTLVLVKAGQTGAEAGRTIESVQGLWDPALLEEWSIEPENAWINGRIFERCQSILPQLLEVTDHWLAGTDSGGGERMLLPGESLLQEIELLESLGMARNSALHAATHAIAEVHPEAGFPSEVGVGQPADLLVLEGDPRIDLTFLRDPLEVIAGGRRLDREAREDMLQRLRAIDTFEFSEDRLVELLSEEWDDHPNLRQRAMAQEILNG
jgi:hypothetical protein